MNSISQVTLSPGTKLLLYADDIVMYRPVNSQFDVSSLQNDVNSIHCWTTEHGLALNTSKSYLMPITHSCNPLQTHLTVDGITLEVLYSTKYLGVNISSGGNTSLLLVKKPRNTYRLTTQEVSPSQPPGQFKTVLEHDFAQARVGSSPRNGIQII